MIGAGRERIDSVGQKPAKSGVANRRDKSYVLPLCSHGTCILLPVHNKRQSLMSIRSMTFSTRPKVGAWPLNNIMQMHHKVLIFLSFP